MGEIKSMIRESIITTNIPSEMSIRFPVKHVRKYMTQKEIDCYFEEIMPLIIRKLRSKCKRLEFLY